MDKFRPNSNANRQSLSLSVFFWEGATGEGRIFSGVLGVSSFFLIFWFFGKGERGNGIFLREEGHIFCPVSSFCLCFLGRGRGLWFKDQGAGFRVCRCGSTGSMRALPRPLATLQQWIGSWAHSVGAPHTTLVAGKHTPCNSVSRTTLASTLQTLFRS